MPERNVVVGLSQRATALMAQYDSAMESVVAGKGKSGGSLASLGSVGSIASIGSAGSIASIGSAGSIASIGSAGSLVSIGSVGSIASIGSVGSILSIGSTGSVLSINGVGAWRAGSPRGRAATAIAAAVMICTLGVVFRRS